jgi:hypothetical protein
LRTNHQVNSASAKGDASAEPGPSEGTSILIAFTDAEDLRLENTSFL